MSDLPKRSEKTTEKNIRDLVNSKEAKDFWRSFYKRNWLQVRYVRAPWNVNVHFDSTSRFGLK